MTFDKIKKIIKLTDPRFKFRWEIYDNWLHSLLSADTIWLDLGCGDNSDVKLLGTKCSFALGADIIKPSEKNTFDYICTDINALPFANETFDFISLRFVTEHLENIPKAFNEINRVLKPKGEILIMTTNKISPYIFLPRLIPMDMKLKIQKKLFKVTETDLYPTFHRLNSKSDFKKLPSNLKMEKLEFIQDTNCSRIWLFLIFYLWHLITKFIGLKNTRTNILAILKKD